MDNEQQNKKKTLKKIIFEVVYWCLLSLLACFGLLCGFKQVQTWDNIEKRLSNIEQSLNDKEESALVREESRRALTLNDSAISDLTNTTWLFDENLTTGYSFLTKQINFVSNEINYVGISGNEEDMVISMFYHTVYGSNYTQVCAGSLDDDYGETYWVNEAFRTIYITGGNAVTDSDLITWLETNATQQLDAEPVEPTYSPIRLNSRYDFRKWFGEVDPLTGCLPQITPSNYFYEIGYLTINGVTYDHIAFYIANLDAGNIVTGYDFQNSAYLIMGGSDYYGSSGHANILLQVTLYAGDDNGNFTNRVNLYKCPMVGGRMQYETGSFLSPTDSVPTSGLMAQTFALNEAYLDWSQYIPSDRAYNLPGLGSSMTIYDALKLDFYNDTYMDFASISAQSTGGNVFTLITNAFKALAPLLSIQVIPGLPIGLLVCLPLVATILVVVIKLVRK